MERPRISQIAPNPPNEWKLLSATLPQEFQWHAITSGEKALEQKKIMIPKCVQPLSLWPNPADTELGALQRDLPLFELKEKIQFNRFMQISTSSIVSQKTMSFGLSLYSLAEWGWSKVLSSVDFFPEERIEMCPWENDGSHL